MQKRRPFQAAAEVDSLSTGAAGALKKLIAASRSSGTLNLANRHLQQVSSGTECLASKQQLYSMLGNMLLTLRPSCAHDRCLRRFTMLKQMETTSSCGRCAHSCSSMHAAVIGRRTALHGTDVCCGGRSMSSQSLTCPTTSCSSCQHSSGRWPR